MGKELDAVDRRWPAQSVEMRSVDDLFPYANNSRTHSQQQIDQIAASINEWGWTIPILVDENGMIIAGHGRIMAAQKLGIKEVPTMVAEGWTEAQKKAYVIADNKLALNADWDYELLEAELKGLDELDFNIDLIGFDVDELQELAIEDIEGEAGLSDEYTTKIEAPIYEPSGDKPHISELLDKSKALELEERILAAEGLPEDIKSFLMAAAKRHYKFRYDKIANYYAHADKEVQELMEQSALVIIDYDKAIEEGFIKMNKALLELRNEEESE